MSWLVWNSYGETEADAVRIDAENCPEAAEEWARRDGDTDPGRCGVHVRNGLDLRVRLEGYGTVYRVQVEAEAVINYTGKEGW